jgi:hypothetical protein
MFSYFFYPPLLDEDFSQRDLVSILLALNQAQDYENWNFDAQVIVIFVLVVPPIFGRLEYLAR